MGKNNGGSRIGAVKDRTQCYNTKTNKFIKRDVETGRFLSSSDSMYKGVRKEASAKKESSVKKTKNTKSSNVIKVSKN